MLYLITSCIALLIGPLFYRYLSSGTGLHKALDGFIFVSLGGLVLIHILPELLHHGGMLAIVFVILGLWGPTASERVFHRYSDITHNFTLALGIGGLLLHTLTDGGAMVLAQQEGTSPLLALGIILHRLPVGLAIWWLLKPQVGSKWASGVLGIMILLTIAGYVTGTQLLSQLSFENTVYLQAFVTGSILHVVLHQPHGDHSDNQPKFEYQAGVGSLIGIALLVLLLVLDADKHDHMQHVHSASHVMQWLAIVAPALLITYAFACFSNKILSLLPQKNIASQWYKHLALPEALLLSFLLLGPSYMLIQLFGFGVLIFYLCQQGISPVNEPHRNTSLTWKYGFGQLIDRSAPWILLSLLVVNLIGHPSVPLDNPILQVVIIGLVFLPSSFCSLGATVLAFALAASGWSTPAVVLALFAAPVGNYFQLKHLTKNQIISFVTLTIGVTLIATTLTPSNHPLFNLSENLGLVSILLLSLLFAASLLRLGPRKFLRRLMIAKPTLANGATTHHHDHGHSH